MSPIINYSQINLTTGYQLYFDDVSYVVTREEFDYDSLSDEYKSIEVEELDYGWSDKESCLYDYKTLTLYRYDPDEPF